MQTIVQSRNLANAHYELRGRVAQMASEMQRQGETILPMHLGNPGLFGLEAHPDLCQAIVENLIPAQAYCDSLGLPQARSAIAEDWQKKGGRSVSIDRIFVGNGVSELINAALLALLNPGDEILLPQPVYPLWSAVTELCGGVVKFYRCSESEGWLPDVDHMTRLVTQKTKAIVLINPNNPTGAVYPSGLLQDVGRLAAEHQLVLFADEIYSDILFDDAQFTHAGHVVEEPLVISFDGLSKNYLMAGYRCAWMVCSGNVAVARDYINGIKKILSMRLCANVPSQYAIELALSSDDYRFLSRVPDLQRRRDHTVAALNKIEGCSCHTPQGAFYLFPRWDESSCYWHADTDWIMSFLKQNCILLAPGSTFSQPDQLHFRMVLLPDFDTLQETVRRLNDFMQSKALV